VSAAHAETVHPPKSASVEVLAAEVRVVMVGNRQITLSVYRQLDEVEVDEMEPWGRVRASRDVDDATIELIGRRSTDGTLVASSVRDLGNLVNIGTSAEWQDWLSFVPARHEAALTVFSRDGYDAVIWVRGDRSFNRERPLYHYAREGAEDMLREFAEMRIDERKERQQLTARLRALPLIVLAGLK